MNEIFKENKNLDLVFFEKYGKNEGEIFIKNKLALLVEIGELANEVKSFKYWSVKKPDYNLMIMEYADCLMFILMFMNTYNLELHESHVDIHSIDELFIKIYKLSLNIEDDIIDLYSHFLLLGSLLGFSKKEIEEAVLKKIEIAKERLGSDY